MTSSVLLPPATGAAEQPRVARRRPPSQFKPLVTRIKAAGLLKPRIGWYVGFCAVILMSLPVLLAALGVLSHSWWALLLAPVAGLITAQIGFLGHDAGHHQITKSNRASHLFGLVAGNLLSGLSFGWWQDKHMRHHTNPNHEGLDPDVGEGIISWSERQQEKKTGWARWMARHQAWLFFPLLTFEGWQLHIAGLRSLRARPRKDRILEAALLGVHIVVYFGVLFTLLSIPQAIVFIVIHQAVYGLLLGSAFAPNHKGMLMPDKESKMDHLHKQVLTSRNIRSSWYANFLLGGLNFQIEHHLFPSMPRPNLKVANPIIRDYCVEIGMPWRECELVESYAECLAYLDKVGHAEAGAGPDPVPSGS